MAVLVFLCFLVVLAGRNVAHSQQAVDGLVANDDVAVIKIPESTFICTQGKAAIVSQGNIIRSVSWYLGNLAFQNKTLSAKIKKAKPAQRKKYQKQIKANDKTLKFTRKREKDCRRGKFKPDSSGGANTLSSLISIDSLNPPADAQGNHIYTNLPIGPTGIRYIGFVGSGFRAGQLLKVVYGSRILFIKCTVTDDTHFSIRLPQPITTDLAVSVQQQGPQGIVSSNAVVIHLKAGNIVGAIGDHVATLIQELPTVSSTLPQPLDYTLNAVMPIPDKFIRRQDVESGISHFSIEPLQGGAALPLDSTPLELSTDGQFVTKLEVRARVQRSSFTSTPVANSQFKLTYYPTTGAPIKPQNPGADVRALLQQAPFSVPSEILAIFPNGLTVEAIDMHGNRYTCDATHQQFGEIEVYHWTRASIAFAVHCVTAPVAPNSSTLPHLINAKIYFEVSRDPAMKLFVVMANNVAGKALNGNLALATGFGDLPFKSVALKVNGNFRAQYSWDSPVPRPITVSNGVTTLDINPPRTDNKLHLLNRLKQEVVELALHAPNPTGQAAAEMLIKYKGLAFTKGGRSTAGLQLFSYHENISTGSTGVTKGIPGASFAHLGTTTIRNYLTGKFNSFFNQVATGTCTISYSDFTINDNGTPSLTCDDTKERRYSCKDPYLASNLVSNAVAPLQYQGSCPGSGSFVVVPGSPTPSPIPLLEASMKSDGVAYGGMTSGTDIIPDTGILESASFSNDGVRELLMKAIARSLRREYLLLLNGRHISPLDVMQNTPQGLTLPIDISPFGEWSTNKFKLSEFSNPPSTAHYSAANNASLLPGDHVTYDPDDWQHYVRFVYRVVAGVNLTAHPYLRDMLRAAGMQAVFARPAWPQQYNAAGPQYQFGTESLIGLVPSTPGVGTAFGRAEAWIFTAAANAYSHYGDDAFRALMLPYFEYLTQNVLSAGQMWTGLILRSFNLSKLYPDAANYPACACQAVGSPTREAGYTAIALHSILKRVLEEVSPMATEMQNVLISLASTRLLKPFLSPSNSWHAMFRNGGALAAVSNPNQLYSSWAQVSPVCQNALLNSSPTAQGGCPGSAGPDAGESQLMVTVSDLELPNSAQWDELRLNLKNSLPDPNPNTPETTLTKLKRRGLYDIDRVYPAQMIALGYCEFLESNNLGHTCN